MLGSLIAFDSGSFDEAYYTSRSSPHTHETDASSASRSVGLLDSVREELATPVPILEVITDRPRNIRPTL